MKISVMQLNNPIEIDLKCILSWFDELLERQ
jgi:hypothetical protein